MSQALLTYISSLLRGESSQFNRMFGGSAPDKATPVTADNLYHNGPCMMYGVLITTTTATGTIDIRDSVTAGGGTVVMTIPIGAAAADGGKYVLAAPIPLITGCYVDYNGGATGTVVPLILRAVV